MEEGQPKLKSLNLQGLVDLHQRLDLVGPEFTDSPTALMSPNGDALGQLPAFNRRAPRPDPRRESGVLLAGFTKATAGEGLLDDDEIAVGDEDILISLPKAAKSQGVSGGHNTLWLEPHTDELLGGDLPEPQFSGAAAGGLTSIAESPEREPSGVAAEPSALASPGRPTSTPTAVASPPRTAATAPEPAAVTSPPRTAQEPAALVSPTRGAEQAAPGVSAGHASPDRAGQAGAAAAAASPAAGQQGAVTAEAAYGSPVRSPVPVLSTEPSAGAVGAASSTPIASPTANNGTAPGAEAVTSPGGLVPQLQACSSPRTNTKEEKKAPNSAEKPISGMRVRDSTCLAAGLSKLCLEKGFSDLDFENDFLMTDSNKVKEMALLFKMEVDARVASPTATAGGGSQRTCELGGAAAGSTAESSVRARVNQLQSAPRPATAPTPAPRAGRPPAGPSSRPSTAAAPSNARTAGAAPGPGAGLAGAAGSRQAASRLRAPSASSRYSTQPATESRPGSSASGRPSLSSRSSTSSIGGPGARAATPAGGRPPVAPASRGLPAWGSRAAAASGPKPAGGRVGSQAASGAAGTPTRTAAARPSSTPSPGARSTGSRAASPTQSPSLTNRPSWGARSPQPAAAASRPSTSPVPGRATSPAAPSPASRVSPRQPAGSTCTAAGRGLQPARSRLAQPGTAQAGGQPRRTATQPASGGTAGAAEAGGDQAHRNPAAQRAPPGSRLAGAGRQRAPAAVSSDTPGPSAAAEAARPTTSNATVPKLPKLQLNPPPANNDNITPNTARLRFLEENPDLAFGGGTKISMSNSPTAQQQPHRKTTVDKHWEAWGDDA